MRRFTPLLAVVLLVGCAPPAGDAGRATAPPAPPATAASPSPVVSGPVVSGPVVSGPPRGSAEPAARWQPRPGLTWQWQLSGPVDLGVPADVYDLDYQTTTAEQVAALHKAGRRMICYVNAGAQESSRPDAGAFADAVLGKPLDGWPDERWLDVRRWDLIEPLLSARVRECRDKGFDAVEPDNLDAYVADSGFPISAADQLTFNRRVAELVHRHGLAVGLKNDVEQVGELVSHFDFAVNEQCAQYRECESLVPFIQAGKAVFHAEYDLPADQFCPVTRTLGLSSVRKRLTLDAWRETC
jgi:hypothetical protein